MFEVAMKYIYFVLICIALSAIISPVCCGAETNAMIHYSESAVDIQNEFALEQGYSIKVLDINNKSGASWIEVYFNSKKVESSDVFAKKDDPFEYIKTITDEDDEETEYLIIRITPIDVIEEPLSVELKIEQFVDPGIEPTEYLILDKKRSLTVGTPLEFEDGYTLDASDLKDGVVVLRLSKNGHCVKEDEIGIGDMFIYSKTVDSKVITIFVAKVRDIFEGADSEVIFLEQVSQRSDIVVGNVVAITVEGVDGGKLKEGDVAIIRYTVLNGNTLNVRIVLDGEQIDQRSDVDAGTYSTVTGNLMTGTHEVVVEIVAGDGTRSTHTKTFVVESGIAADAAQAAASAVEKLIEDNEKASGVLKVVEDLKAPGFGAVLCAVGIVLAVLIRRRG